MIYGAGSYHSRKSLVLVRKALATRCKYLGTVIDDDDDDEAADAVSTSQSYVVLSLESVMILTFARPHSVRNLSFRI